MSDEIEITDEQIKQLRAEAVQAGDRVQVVLCDLARVGDDIDPGAYPWDDTDDVLDEADRISFEFRGTTSERARAVCERAIREGNHP